MATIDDALEMLVDRGPEFHGGLSNHGPMAAEALMALGRGEAMVPWVERYRSRLDDAPRGIAPIAPDEWREALGEIARVADWERLFERELAFAPWGDVLAAWTARLAPGLMAGATHGLIRTAHAARNLAAGETAPRLQELARGLAYWAARYQALPGAPGGGGLGVAQALSRVPILPYDGHRRGLIFDEVRALDGWSPFGPAAGLLDTGGDVSRTLSELTAAMAGLYLANNSHAPIAFIHGVTAPSALRMLAPSLPPETVRAALGYAWQACAALYATYGRESAGEVVVAVTPADDLVDRAVDCGDEHAIKFTEACLREHALNPDPVYLAAAADVSQRLSG
ncbi:MAG: hypothetical protein ACKVT1_01430 [Dehalococcoidia bacterium]